LESVSEDFKAAIRELVRLKAFAEDNAHVSIEDVMERIDLHFFSA
jgi:hypothetical protein